MMKKKSVTYSNEQKDLLDAINKIRQDLDTVYQNYQYTSDPDLIDCYIYKMNSMNLRYKYLKKQLEHA